MALPRTISHRPNVYDQLTNIVIGENHGLLITMINPAHGCQSKSQSKVSGELEEVSRELVELSRGK